MVNENLYTIRNKETGEWVEVIDGHVHQYECEGEFCTEKYLPDMKKAVANTPEWEIVTLREEPAKPCKNCNKMLGICHLGTSDNGTFPIIRVEPVEQNFCTVCGRSLE